MDNIFSNFIHSGVERIDRRAYGYVFPLLILRKYNTQANGVIHGERSTGPSRDEMIEMVLLF